MDTVKFLKNHMAFKKGKLYNVTSRHAQLLAKDKIAEIIEPKEDKQATDRKTK
jgi:hypothetical protein